MGGGASLDISGIINTLCNYFVCGFYKIIIINLGKTKKQKKEKKKKGTHKEKGKILSKIGKNLKKKEKF